MFDGITRYLCCHPFVHNIVRGRTYIIILFLLSITNNTSRIAKDRYARDIGIGTEIDWHLLNCLDNFSTFQRAPIRSRQCRRSVESKSQTVLFGLLVKQRSTPNRNDVSNIYCYTRQELAAYHRY